MDLKLLDLFSGIGGFSYAAEHLVGGYKTIGFCEIDESCQLVLKKHWPNTRIWNDVRTMYVQKEDCDVITAGFPCQDLSIAGKQLGLDGERSSLFYEVMRLVREVRPRYVLLENVANLLSHKNGETFQEVLFQIAKAGYDAEWSVIPASDVGACHKRNRVWIIAYTCSQRRDKPSHALCPGRHPAVGGFATDTSGVNLQGCGAQGLSEQQAPGGPWGTLWSYQGIERLNPDWHSYISKPVLRRGDDGLSNRVHRLKQLGNSIVPQVAAIPLKRILELESLNSIPAN